MTVGRFVKRLALTLVALAAAAIAADLAAGG